MPSENSSTSEIQGVQGEVSASYEAPQIESVLTAEDLEREVAYAGTPLPSDPV